MAASAQRVVFADPDHLTTALRDVEVDYLRLSPGAYTATFTALDLGPLRIQLAMDDAHIARGHVAPGTSLLLLGLSLPEDLTLVNGFTIRDHDVMHLGPGSPLFARAGGPLHWSGISFHSDALREAMDTDNLPQAEQFLLRRNASGHASLAAFARDAECLAAVDPMRVSLGTVRRALVEDAMRLTAALMQDPAQGDGAIRAVHRRVRLVAEAEEFLAAHMGRPVYSEDLHRALGAPMRTLHNAFVAVHGMSVHRYLRLRRLHLARAALRARIGSPAQVKIAALDHGFWHFGRFAQDYRALFGELPSETSCMGGRTAVAERR